MHVRTLVWVVKGAVYVCFLCNSPFTSSLRLKGQIQLNWNGTEEEQVTKSTVPQLG